MIKKTLLTCLLLSISGASIAAQRIDLYVGEIKILKMGNIERLAVGNPAVVSNSLLNNGQFILIAEEAGSSNIHIWFANGKETDYMVRVSDKTNNLVKRKIEVENLLGQIEGISIDMVGDRIVLSGLVDTDNKANIDAVQSEYSEVLLNINYAVKTLLRKKLEVEDLLADVEGLEVRVVGDNIVLNGLVDNGHGPAIDTVKSVFTEVMDLTQRASLDMDMPDNKMVLMNIKITEFNKNFLENLGIQWDTTVAGFAGGVAFDVQGNDTFRAAGQPAPSFATSLPTNVSSSLGYFGIASEITSRINFAVNSGNALILAEPRLAARSGGTANFLSGGEFPIQISNINGTTVEFKQFGIQLSVEPTVDISNNVRAKVTTELSSINNAVAVDGIPGLNTRKTDADVILNSGETLVMSGLINQEASKDIQGIKWLKDIPILGKLFSSTSFRDNKSELVIFVTPQVFDANSEINQRALDYFKAGMKDTIDAIGEDSLNIVY